MTKRKARGRCDLRRSYGHGHACVCPAVCTFLHRKCTLHNLWHIGDRPREKKNRRRIRGGYIIAKGDGNDTDTNCIAAAKDGGNRNHSVVHSRGPQKAAPHRNAKDTRNGQWEDWGTECLSKRLYFNHTYDKNHQIPLIQLSSL